MSCSGRNHGIDVDVAMESFSRLRALPNNYLTQLVRPHSEYVIQVLVHILLVFMIMNKNK